LEDRIVLNEFPEDWQHHTMGFPVALSVAVYKRKAIVVNT
jgi:hypothetical protein